MFFSSQWPGPRIIFRRTTFNHGSSYIIEQLVQKCCKPPLVSITAKEVPDLQGELARFNQTLYTRLKPVSISSPCTTSTTLPIPVRKSQLDTTNLFQPQTVVSEQNRTRCGFLLQGLNQGLLFSLMALPAFF